MHPKKETRGAWLAENLLVYYQPKVAIFGKSGKSHNVTGFEALVRMQIDGTILLPGSFLPFMTQFQKTVVFETVLNNVGTILESSPDVRLAKLSFGVNIEPEILSSFRVLGALRRFPKKYRKHVVVEILETSVPDFDMFVRAAWFVKKLGFSLALDDFGSGGPSFRIVLTKLITSVKLDNFFIPGKFHGATRSRERIMVADVSRMLRSMGVTVIAEQIETARDLAFVKEHVHEGQGFFFGRPAPFEAWKKKNGSVVLKL